MLAIYFYGFEGPFHFFFDENGDDGIWKIPLTFLEGPDHSL